MKTFKLDAEIAQKTENVNFLGFQFRTIGPDAVEAFLKGCAVGEKVKIEINSPGGSVIAGLAIANAIKNSKAHVIAHVTGIAASMASVVACACDEIEMEEAAFLMIHNPWSEAEGDAEDLKHAADILEGMETAMRAFYRGKFPAMSDAELDQLMADETWMTGAECKERGMVCELVPADVRAAACLTKRHFKHIPEGAAKYLAEISADAKPAEPNPAPAETQGTATAGTPAPAETQNTATASAPTAQGADDWEARYKGLSRKMSEKAEELAALRAQLDALTNTAAEARSAVEASNAALAASNAAMESAKAQIEDLKSQLGACRGDLEKAKADLSAVTERADKAEKELAQKGEQLSTLEKAHALLTAGVLKPGGEAEVTSASGKTPEERESIRKAAKKNRR